MVEMFRYLTGIIEKRDRKEWRNLVIMNLISPVTDLFNFSALIFIVNMVVRDRQASKEIIIFAGFMSISCLMERKGCLKNYMNYC